MKHLPFGSEGPRGPDSFPPAPLLEGGTGRRRGARCGSPLHQVAPPIFYGSATTKTSDKVFVSPATRLEASEE